MAVLTSTVLSTVLPQNYQSRIAKQWNNSAVLLSKLEVREAETGKNCAFVVDVAGKTASAFADGYAVQTAEFDSNTRLIATLNWAEYRSPFSLTRRAIASASHSRGGAQALDNIVMDELVNANAKILSTVNVALHSGAGTNDAILGLDNALITSGSYGGINVGTYTSFASHVTGASGTLSVDKLAALEKAIYVDSGVRPNCILMAPDVMQKYSVLLTNDRRWIGSAPMDGSTAPDSMTFQGIPCFRDKDMASGTLKMLNTDSMHIEVLFDPSAEKDAVVFMSAPGVAGPGDHLEGAGLPLILTSLAKDGGSVKYSLDTPSIQLCVRNPNQNGILTGIT